MGIRLEKEKVLEQEHITKAKARIYWKRLLHREDGSYAVEVYDEPYPGQKSKDYYQRISFYELDHAKNFYNKITSIQNAAMLFKKGNTNGIRS